MQANRCPTCHSRISLEAIVQDEAARKLLAMLARMDNHAAAALLSYLGLFRAAQRDLANNRALRLAEEVLKLHPDQGTIIAAMNDTVESLRERQLQPGWKPLRNHNYLASVVETVAARPVRSGTLTTQVEVSTGSAPKGKVAQALMALEEIKNG